MGSSGASRLCLMRDLPQQICPLLQLPRGGSLNIEDCNVSNRSPHSTDMINVIPIIVILMIMMREKITKKPTNYMIFSKYLLILGAL